MRDEEQSLLTHPVSQTHTTLGVTRSETVTEVKRCGVRETGNMELKSTVHCSLFTVYCLLFAIRCWLFATVTYPSVPYRANKKTAPLQRRFHFWQKRLIYLFGCVAGASFSTAASVCLSEQECAFSALALSQAAFSSGVQEAAAFLLQEDMDALFEQQECFAPLSDALVTVSVLAAFSAAAFGSSALVTNAKKQTRDIRERIFFIVCACC